jgi:hypothetical protein
MTFYAHTYIRTYFGEMNYNLIFKFFCVVATFMAASVF